MLAVWIVAVSPLIGSFLSVVVTRFGDAGFDVSGRSRCFKCHQQLSLRDNVPVISWLVLKGRCRTCGEKISPIYLVCELGALAIALWAALVVDEAFLIVTCLLGWTLMALSLIDIRHLRIPNLLTGLVFTLGSVVVVIFFLPDLVWHLAGAVLGFAVLFSVRHLYRRLRGRDGLGEADERLLAAGGLWVGAGGVFSVLLVGSVLGLLGVGLANLVGQKIAGDEAIPFGPFLAAGIWITWLYGPVFVGV